MIKDLALIAFGAFLMLGVLVIVACLVVGTRDDHDGE